MKSSQKMTYKTLVVIAICWFALFSSKHIFAAETNNVPTRINADKLECDYEERIVYLRGSVVVRDTKGILKADNATVYFKKTKEKKDSLSSTANVGSFSRVVAVGNVRMSSNDKAVVVVSDKAVWNKNNNTIVLTGGPPMVKQGASYIKAKRIVYDLTTGKCDFFPEPQMVFSIPDSEKTKFIE
ncbi:MAG: hypothetical protein DRI44_03025 [Chlamydiae bacterium]|nr:MAG: hypothetical protein DRI44_03025 [Chlamydiota bacterium]